MEKPSPPPSPNASKDYQCVGRLEIAPHIPVGFLCGSISVPTDETFNHHLDSALVPSRQMVSAPRYRMLPRATDLNALPVVPNLPIGTTLSKATGELPWESDAISSNLSRKSDALAVSGLVEYGDEIDVIAPADILKQIFKMPYSKAQLSVAVRRIGQTLVLNTGPGADEGEKLVRRHNLAEQSLYLNFAMHSVRVEACDCPPSHRYSSEQSNSSVLPGRHASQVGNQSDDATGNEEFNQDSFYWKSKKNKTKKSRQPIKKASHVGEKPRCSMQESEKHKRIGNNGFLRVLIWQFHNFRMLLGSDLHLFSNEKYVAVSLHLWDVTRQVTPLTWLEAWLDNVMASVPELAICYHQNGVVQGYELLKTDDIFLLKGISDDGTPAFSPNVVQQNGLSVLRFLQENCKQDPGAYWLYKEPGEDVIQLYDLSGIPKNHSSNDCDDGSSSLPSIMHGERSDSTLSLGTLLYRIAHRLSLSVASKNRAKCASFFRKCLEYLDQSDHLVVRACAHEQFARLLLNHDEELELLSESLPIECEVAVIAESLDHSNGLSESVGYQNVSSLATSLAAEHRVSDNEECFHDVRSEASAMMTLEANLSTPDELMALVDWELKDSERASPTSSIDEKFAVCKISSASAHAVETVSDPISSKLSAVHHVSQAIKSLRWMRQLQSTEAEFLNQDNITHDGPPSINFSVCTCGDTDCIEVCDIREWLPTSKIDSKLWKLVLLLGESYLALGQAYKEDNQFRQALKVVEIACSVYGSMPQRLENTTFISSMVKNSFPTKCIDRKEMISYITDAKEGKSSCNDDCNTFEQLSSTYLFWAKAWMLVGDVYVEFHFIKGKEVATVTAKRNYTQELRMPTEVVKEVQRLKKKLGQYYPNCSSCSLVNCSCQSDRASSGSSASSSSGDRFSVAYGRKHAKRSYAKCASQSLLAGSDEDHGHHRVENRKCSVSAHRQPTGDCDTTIEASDAAVDMFVENSLGASNSGGIGVNKEMHDAQFRKSCQTDPALKESPKMKDGGIFKYLGDSITEDAECNLSNALNCYEEAKKTLVGLPNGQAELQTVMKKIGWVCNEMGRIWVERKELTKAELAFSDAICAFREVSDHTNIILINCNLGHGRRALAEEFVSKIESLKIHGMSSNVCKQALQTAKLEYSESLRYYEAAKSELNAIVEEADSVPNSLRNEAYTQLAHTYLRLGMLLAKEDTTAEVYETRALEDRSIAFISPKDKRAKKEVRRHEISANDAIREALSLYESLGELRKQEAAYAYFQLASYQRDCCLKFLKSDHKKRNLPKGENCILQRVKQYSSLAERNWQKAEDFYGPKTHPTMYLTILMERSALLITLSSALHSNAMLESAVSRMLEGRHMTENSDSFGTNYPELHAKFWVQLQMLLKKILTLTLPVNADKSATALQTPSNKYGDSGKLRELYKMSLKHTDLNRLHAMHALWTS